MVNFNHVRANEICVNCELYIPKIIHKIWIPFKADKPNPAEDWMHFHNTTLSLYPDYNVKIWQESEIEGFIKKNYPKFYPIYSNYDVKIKKVDSFKYLVLHKEGGIVMDWGFYPIKNIEELLQGAKTVFAEEIPHRIASSFVASVPNAKILDKIIQKMPSTAHLYELQSLGPDFLTKVVRDFSSSSKDEVSILPPKYFYPFDWGQIKEEAVLICKNHLDTCHNIYPDAYMVKFWKLSWAHQYNSSELDYQVI